MWGSHAQQGSSFQHGGQYGGGGGQYGGYAGEHHDDHAAHGGFCHTCCEHIMELQAKLYVMLSALFVHLIGLLLLGGAIFALTSKSFPLFSELMFDNSVVSPFAIMIILMVTAVLTLFGSCFGIYGAFKEHPAKLKMYMCFAFLFGGLFAFGGTMIFISKAETTPSVYRTVNEICQDPGAISNALACVRGATPNGTLAGRRLARESHTAINSFFGDLGRKHGCRLLFKLCEPPVDFNPAGACVCAGIAAAAPVAAPVPNITAVVATTLPPGVVPIPVMRGKYCEAWDATPGEQPWCFVQPGVFCGSSVQAIDGKHSTGPCTSEVDSRSGIVLRGLSRLDYVAGLVLIIALVLFLSACCAHWLAGHSHPQPYGNSERKPFIAH